MAPDKTNAAPNLLKMNFDLVTIRVGETGHTVDFPVYRELLSSVSPYFRSVFEGGFKEADDRVISLVDVTEQTFRIFLQWAHAQAYRSGSGALIPDISVLPASVGTESGQAAQATDISALPNIPKAQRESLDQAFDQPHYQSQPRSNDTRAKMYYHDKTWQENYRMMLESYLNVFVFADQYTVHQLRDDILTAMVGQAHTWEWFPDLDEDLLTSAYDRLPNSAQFIRFLVLSTTYCWVADTDCVARTELLRQWNPDFAFEEEYASCFDEDLRSCAMHEHLVLDKDQCRERMKNKTHVFAELIDACAKDSVSMVQEQKKD
ncbi:hypothetical protein CC86DRAFT_457428 [Ophiobolus disseminans]|uniref:BTB domain-containing protein n=1 Tax=Ophiobolus disseminans TaxID=1469910 RepID=A0A6A6ZTX8_9PLEO|nr:hypothetical protein CC86DRAFT_457428 [Ophiobolus disseminans]